MVRRILRRRYTIGIVLTALLGLSLASYSHGAEAKRATRVLMLHSESKFTPGDMLVEQAATDVLQRSGQSVEFFAEYLDSGRFPEESHYWLFREYLRVKYRQQPPDLIIAFLARKFEMAGQLPAELFPGVPVVLATLTEEQIPRIRLGANVTGLVQRVDFTGGLELILKLQPETERIIVIGGVAPLDQAFLSHTRAAARPLASRVYFEFWDKRSVAEMVAAVASLPPRTAIFFTSVFRDSAGNSFFPEEVSARLVKAANAPIYVFLDTMLGKGTVGGSIASLEGAGKRAGELASTILNGTPPAAIPFEIRQQGVPMFDARALKKWGISEGRLPPNSIIRFGPRSFWEEYRWYILAAVILILLQSAMILELLLQRRRRMRIQADLEESQQMMGLATSASELGLWSRDLNSGSVWANPTFRSILGFGKDITIEASDLLNRVHPDDSKEVRAEVERSQQEDLPFEREFRVLLPDGTIRWLLTKARTVRTPQGSARRMGVVMDISERKNNAETLEKERAFLRQVIDIDPNFIFAKDRQGRFTLVNQAVADAYGTTVDALIGKTDADFNANAEEVEHFRRMDLEVMDLRQERFIPEEHITDAKGEVRWLQTVKRPILDKEGRADQVLGSATDITQRRLAELEAARQRAEVMHISRVSMMGQLASAMAHELNQPLGAILSNAEAAELFLESETPSLEEVRAILADIRKDDQRAADVIRRMRTLLKRRELAVDALDVGKLIEGAVALARPDALLRQIKVDSDVSETLPPVEGDRVHLEQVLLNLMLNGMDSLNGCPPERRYVIVCAASSGGGVVQVSVTDGGCGIPADRLGQIFEPFYTTKTEGMGIGLAICRTIIEAHRGSIWAANNPQGGATFSFTLPTCK